MDDELRSKIEGVVEEKVEESLEENADTKFSKLVDKKIERKLQEGKIEATKEISSNNEMNRRSFLKILGLGGAGLGLASSATAANLLQGTKINGNTVFHQGNDYSGTGSSNSALDADQVDGFDIQKNGNDTNGVINFNTNQKTITVDGTFIVGDPPPEPPDSAINQWKLDEGTGTTAADSIGSNNLSTSGAAWLADANAVGGYVLEILSGDSVSGSRISVLQGSQAFSFAFTLDMDNQNTSKTSHIMINEDGSASDIVTITIGNSSSDRLEFGARENGTGIFKCMNISQFSGLTRFCGTYSGSGGSWTIYANASSQSDTGGNPNWDGTNQGFYLGENGGGNKFLDGRIDNPIVYDSELSPSEVQTDYDIQPYS